MKKVGDLLPEEVQVGCRNAHILSRLCGEVGRGEMEVGAAIGGPLATVHLEQQHRHLHLPASLIEDPNDRPYLWDLNEPEEE